MGMFHLGIFVSVLTAVGLGFYLRWRFQVMGERWWSTLPSREAAREKWCYFALRGYWDARSEGDTSVANVTQKVAETSTSAGFIPNQKFHETIEAQASLGTLENAAKVANAWLHVYTKLNADHAEEWALRKAAIMWSIHDHKPGAFEPDWFWSSYPLVTPETRHTVVQQRSLIEQSQGKHQRQLDVAQWYGDELVGDPLNHFSDWLVRRVAARHVACEKMADLVIASPDIPAGELATLNHDLLAKDFHDFEATLEESLDETEAMRAHPLGPRGFAEARKSDMRAMLQEFRWSPRRLLAVLSA